MFDFNAAGSRLFAAVTAIAMTAAFMAYAIVPASPAGLIA